MLYTVEQIVDALCNEYEALFTQKTFNPASDLSYDEYRNVMLKRSLPELIPETSTDQEYDNLETISNVLVKKMSTSQQ